MTYVYTHC